MILSLGGWSADQGGAEIADSCTSVPPIAAAYEQAITTCNVSRLDMDGEGRPLTNTAGINRRNGGYAARGLRLWSSISKMAPSRNMVPSAPCTARPRSQTSRVSPSRCTIRYSIRNG